MVTVTTTVSIYEPPSSGLPFLSVIIRPGQENNLLVTAFATLSEAEAFNREMNAEIIPCVTLC